jgi:hypothetical protein
VSRELELFSPPGVLPAGSVDNTELATMAAGTTKGRARAAGTGAVTDLTGAQLGESVRRQTSVTDAATTGVVATLTVAETTTQIRVTGSAAATIHGMTGDTTTFGKTLEIHVESGATAVWTFVNESASSGLSGERLRTPRSQTFSIRSNETAVFQYYDNRWRCVSVVKLTDAELIAPISTTNNTAVPFYVFVSCPSGGSAGTADDVTVWSANAPYALRILDASLLVSTAVVGSDAALRTAAAGAGTVVLPDIALATRTFTTAAVGPVDAVASATATVALSGSLFLRRSDRSVVGELMLTCIRT